MKAPMCRSCNSSHWSSEPHKWPDTNTAHIRDAEKFIPTKRVHKTKEETKVCTQIRKVSIRQLRANLAKELNDLPFDIIKNGKVIGRVNAKHS